MRTRRLIRRALLAVAIATVIATCTIGGMTLGLLIGSPDRHATTFGTLETQVVPDLDGHVTVFVPLVDWRVRLLDHRAPVRLELELRAIDRARAGEGISSSSTASRSLEDVRADSERVIRASVHRAVVAASIGGLAGSIVAGALITSTRLRRRWLLIAPVFGAVFVAGVVGPSIRSLDDLGSRQLRVTATGDNAEELPRVLRFAEQLLDVGDEYEDHYRTALESVSNVADFASRQDTPRIDATAVVISDFHDNVFVLDALKEFAGESPVFAVGDFVSVGARIEQRTAPQIAALGSEVVAVSGNHDTAEYMESLADAGATVLDAAQPSVEVGGLLVAGYPDPLERARDTDGEHRLRVYGAEYAAQVEDVLEWWDDLEVRPDVVMVHQHGFAHRLFEHVRSSNDDRPLLILTGHDHEPHVHQEGRLAIVDAGTIGAGGLAAVGVQSASFAQLEIADGRVVAVRLVEVEPLTGVAKSERIALR